MEIKCPYCGAEDDRCVSDLWEYKGDENEAECRSCEKSIIVSADVTVRYEAKRTDCNDGEHEYGKWYRHDYEKPDGKYSLWCRNCNHCDDSEIERVGYKDDLPKAQEQVG